MNWKMHGSGGDGGDSGGGGGSINEHFHWWDKNG